MPLRTLLPLSILLIGLITVISSFLISKPLVIKEVVNEQTRASQLSMSRMQTVLEASARFANPVFTQELMSVATETDGTLEVLISGQDGTIRASSTFGLIGTQIQDYLEPSVIQLFTKALQTIAPLSHLSDDRNTLTTLGRVCPDRSTARKPSSDCEVLIIHQNLGLLIQEHIDLFYQQLAINSFGILLSALITILLVRLKLLLPLRTIQDALQAYERGHTETRIEASGNSETALLGNAVDELLDHVEEAQTASEFSEQRFRAMFENDTEGMVVITEQGFITDINQAAATLFDYGRSELLGSRVERLMPAEQAEHHREYVDHYVETGEAKIIGSRGRELTGKKKDGTFFPLKLGVGEVHTGNVRYFVGTIVDLTEITHLQDQLQRSQKMDAIGQLAGGIAHDFNNLLGIVIGNLDLLQRRIPDDPKLKKFVDKALVAATRGADLTRRLLGFSRQKADKDQSTDVHETIANLQDLIDRSMTSRIELELALANDLWNANVDRGQLEDVLINLALNARDAMPEGGRLIIEAENLQGSAPIKADFCFGDGSTDYVQISITDTGYGIPKALQEKIFEPFFTTKEESQGTGLGLAMVYGFIKRCGGCLSLYSEQGMGTTVRLYLPRIHNVATISPIDPEDMSTPGGAETILVVDDERDLLEIARALLSGVGYRVLTANNGTQALDVIQQNPGIDLLFSDVVMPGTLSGFELAREANRLRPAMKILLASGFTGRLLTIENGDEWKDRIISKPYRANEITQRIRKLLDD